MKKVICIVLSVVLLAGTVSALELSNSTFSGGIGFDYIRGAGKDYDTNAGFPSTVAGVSLYGTYDLKVGKIWYSRLEYDLIMFPSAYNFKGDDYGKDSGFRRSASKKRIGGYFGLRVDDRNVLNLGGAVTTSTMKLTSKDFKEKYTNTFLSLSLIIEWQYNMGEHFTFRLGIDPDVSFITVDEMDYDGEDAYTMKQTRAAINISFFGGARLGIAYKFN